MDEQKKRRRDKRRPTSNCLKCKHAIFDEQWGEYKCGILKHRIYNPEAHTGCKDYKKTSDKCDT